MEVALSGQPSGIPLAEIRRAFSMTEAFFDLPTR